jgi:hypothetical protein
LPKRQTENAHRVSLQGNTVSCIGPIYDPERERKMLSDVVEKDIFPNCKFINRAEEIDDVTRRSIAGIIAKRMNIDLDEKFPPWWSRHKKFVKAKLNRCRTDANSAMRKKYLGMKLCAHSLDCNAGCLCSSSSLTTKVSRVAHERRGD